MAKPDIRIKPQKGWQSAELGDDYMLLLRIGDFEEVIKLPPDQEVILGRVEEDFHLDLTPYHATDRGVSRLHAAICQKAEMVQVKDLDSTNGTFLNGRQVGSYGWSIVRHNDELRLGQLSMTVHFDW